MIRVILLSFLLLGSIAISAQTPTPTPRDESDFQSWNDVTITRPISKRVDLVIPLTLRLGDNLTYLQEKRIGVAVALKPHTRVTITPGYNFIHSRNSSRNLIRENRLTLAASLRFPVKIVGISHRSLLEYRIRTTGKSWRYRSSVTLEKQLPDSWVKGTKAFVTDELFYDITAERLSRNRLSIGFNKILSKKLSLDLFYMRQDEINSSNPRFHAIGTHLRVRL